MKKDIHPKYFPKSTIRCACGAVFTVGSTKELMETEICSQCHPFYTGKEKIIDKMGKVEKFKKKLAQKEALSQKKSKKKEKLKGKK
jgi:large subunit ribosomal protein L31